MNADKGATRRKRSSRESAAVARSQKGQKNSETVQEIRPDDLRAFRRQMLQWYDQCGRRLPWRESTDPYRIWISEIMLQQTTVTAVIPYFERFVRAFPDVHALAVAPIDHVLRQWEGLGYYSRARNLHQAARNIVELWNGELPNSPEMLRTLPGIGRYTAGAIASFAFNQPAAILEANTERVYARLLAHPDDVRRAASQRRLWNFADTLVPANRCGDFNQALMDLGARVCTPNEPSCIECPVRQWCRAYQYGKPEQFPVRASRPAITNVTELAIIIQHRGRYLVLQRDTKERWAGLWDFWRIEIPSEDDELLNRDDRADSRVRTLWSDSIRLPTSAESAFHAQTGINAGPPKQWKAIQYSVTRYRVRLLAVVCGIASGRLSRSMPADRIWKWVSMSELESMPMPVTSRKLVTWLSRASTE